MNAQSSCASEPSAIIQAAVAKSKELSEWISAQHPGGVPPSLRNMLAAVLYSIALDHRASVVLLYSHGARSSAHALARSVLEAYTRGVWVHRAAADNELERLAKDGYMPKLDTMVRRLNEDPGLGRNLARVKAGAWDTLSDFAHANMRQVRRWVAEGLVAPQHDVNECVRMLEAVDLIGINALLGLASLAGSGTHQMADEAQQLIKGYDEAAPTAP
jgi:hypothetical protein